jgi:hypothetical protein
VFGLGGGSTGIDLISSQKARLDQSSQLYGVVMGKYQLLGG